ncbi:MAG TPA: MBL fold metallo-hydrolase [Acidimicrobiales bacterium]|nr:MBL fold metallo-hydrolase [Acidimicrobiales bacterium]
MKQEQEPARDDVTEVAPGVLRLQLPIAMPGLGHVNAYALLDGTGAAVVDPGLPDRASYNVLRRRLADAGIRPRRVHTVLVTHSHPDHYGGAGRLADETGAALATHAAFRLWWAPGPCDHDVDEVDDADLEAAFGTDRRTTPWGGPGFRFSRRRRLAMRLARLGLSRFKAPRPTRRLRHGERLVLAGREWQAVHTPGHTLDHLCLHDPETGTLLSGDHVLPTITPHISGHGTGRDPLKGFLASLERVAALPGVATVLPAHGHPFDDLRQRVADIRRHHGERLDRLRAAFRDAGGGPCTVEELSQALFRPAHWGYMAESETYAHLEHLRLVGEVERTQVGERAVYALATRTSAT